MSTEAVRGFVVQPTWRARQGAPPYRQVAIACDDVQGMVAAGIPQIVALTQEPWRYLKLDTGHWPMLSAPAKLAEMLDGLTHSP